MRTRENTTGITNIYNLIILDESGSMRSIYEQALGGANETIQTIRAALFLFRQPWERRRVAVVNMARSAYNLLLRVLCRSGRRGSYQGARGGQDSHIQNREQGPHRLPRFPGEPFGRRLSGGRLEIAVKG